MTTKVLSIACPKCGAPPGDWCDGPPGTWRTLHNDRSKEASRITREANRKAKAEAEAAKR